MGCSFCDLSTIRTREIYRDELVRVFPTNIPIVPGHILVCPTRCVASFDLLKETEQEAIFNMLKKVKQSLTTCFKAEGFNYAWNEGATAGQTVPHLHIHVLPRVAGDSGIHGYDPRQFLYRPGSREAVSEEELLIVSRNIRHCMQV
jgi:diadenosine tetraphosphate (Ap4A) HIT family hydrolase